MADIIGNFKVMIIVVLFYSFSITTISHVFVENGIAAPLQYIAQINSTAGDDLTNQLDDSLTTQQNIPLLDIGALIFYSGNFLIDLLVNFIYAIPQMFGFLIWGISVLINIDPYFTVAMETFAVATMTALYIVGLIQLLTDIRSGRII